MERKLPQAFYWFSKLNSMRFIPWTLDGEPDRFERLNELFEQEHNEERQVQAFGSRQDMDTYCGFEVIDGVVKENIIVFHSSWQESSKRNIIESEHPDIFAFLSDRVLPEMRKWISEDSLDRYIKK